MDDASVARVVGASLPHLAIGYARRATVLNVIAELAEGGRAAYENYRVRNPFCILAVAGLAGQRRTTTLLFREHGRTRRSRALNFLWCSGIGHRDTCQLRSTTSSESAKSTVPIQPTLRVKSLQVYIESLKQKEPEIIFDASQLRTKEDWIRAGKVVFEAENSFFPASDARGTADFSSYRPVCFQERYPPVISHWFQLHHSPERCFGGGVQLVRRMPHAPHAGWLVSRGGTG